MPKRASEPSLYALVVWHDEAHEGVNCVPIAEARRAAAMGRCFIVVVEPEPFNPPRLEAAEPEIAED